MIVLLTGNLVPAAIDSGFIPLRLTGPAMPVDHGFALPAWLTPLSATMVHGSLIHLGLNLVMLLYCGRLVERAVGIGGIAALYLVGAYAAAAGQWALEPLAPVPMIGASGAISAIIAAYALLYGESRARAAGPLGAGLVHALWLGATWVAIQLLVSLASIGGAPIAVGAHIGGFAAGLLLTKPLLLWRYRSA